MGRRVEPLVVEAALVPGGRAALSLDSEGEAKITFVVPASDAGVLAVRFADLMNRTLRLTIEPE